MPNNRITGGIVSIDEIITGTIVVFLASTAFLLIATLFLMTWDDLKTTNRRKKHKHDRNA